LSEANRKDLEEIKEVYIKGLKFHHVDTIQEVIGIALLDSKVDNPLKIE
jgi:ATP-dependent Lon protease